MSYTDEIASHIESAREADQVGWDDDNHFESSRFVLVEVSRHDQSIYVNVFDSQEEAAEYHDNQEYPEDWPVIALYDKVDGIKYFPVSHTTFEEVPA